MPSETRALDGSTVVGQPTCRSKTSASNGVRCTNGSVCRLSATSGALTALKTVVLFAFAPITFGVCY